MTRTYEDSYLELAHRLDGDPLDTYELATEMSADEAELCLQVLDELAAEEQASDIVSRLRQQGHTL